MNKTILVVGVLIEIMVSTSILTSQNSDWEVPVTQGVMASLLVWTFYFMTIKGLGWVFYRFNVSLERIPGIVMLLGVILMTGGCVSVKLVGLSLLSVTIIFIGLAILFGAKKAIEIEKYYQFKEIEQECSIIKKLDREEVMIKERGVIGKFMGCLPQYAEHCFYRVEEGVTLHQLIQLQKRILTSDGFKILEFNDFDRRKNQEVNEIEIPARFFMTSRNGVNEMHALAYCKSTRIAVFAKYEFVLAREESLV